MSSDRCAGSSHKNANSSPPETLATSAVNSVLMLVEDLNIHLSNTHPYLQLASEGAQLRANLRKHIDALAGGQRVKPVRLDVVQKKYITSEAFGAGWELLRHRQSASGLKLLELGDMFRAANQHAIDESRHYCSNQSAVDKFVERRGNVIGVVGIAGIGKTTLGKQHLKLINDRLMAADDCYLFHVVLRQFDFDIRITVVQFLLKSTSGCSWLHSQENDAALLELIKASPNVYIVIDGLDEARLDLSNLPDAGNCPELATPKVIFASLLEGNLLPRAYKMLTSRPGAYYDLQVPFMPFFTAVVEGLGEESLQQLVERSCEREADKVRKALEVNPSAKGLCFIPLFAKLVISLAKRLEVNSSAFSIADIFTTFVIDCIRKSRGPGELKEDPNDLLKLAGLALTGMRRNRFQFYSEDLTEYGVDPKAWTAFINTQSGHEDIHVSILEGDKVFFFSHLLWQEYFASLRLLFATDLKDFVAMQDVLKKEDWEMALRFILGLLNPEVYRKLRVVIPSLLTNTLEDKARQVADLCVSVASEYAALPRDFTVQLESRFDSESIASWGSFINRRPDNRLFKLCVLAHESRDEVLAGRIADALPDHILISGTIPPGHAIGLCHVLRCRSPAKEPVKIAVGTCINAEPAIFAGNALHLFLDGLSQTLHKVTKLNIKDTKLNERELEAILKLIPSLEELSLRSCDMGSDDMEFVLVHLIRRRKRIKLVDLSGNRLDIKSMRLLAQCVHKINWLDVESCNISDEQLRILAASIEDLSVPLNWLNLGGNDLGCHSLEYIAQCAHRIERLDFRGWEFSKADLDHLCGSIGRLEHPMRLLDLSNGKFGPGGIERLSLCIRNVEMLLLLECGIGEQELDCLSVAIANLNTPLKFVNLSQNQLGPKGFDFLARCVHNIEMLWLCNCNVEGSKLGNFSKAIAQLKTPLKFLNVTYNQIGDEGAGYLLTCKRNIVNLRCDNCDISDDLRKLIEKPNVHVTDV